MNPFDQPPVGQPMSFDPPEPAASGPRRGRTALIALLSVGVIGAGVVGVSQFASADPADEAAAATEDTIAPIEDDGDDAADESTDENPADDEVPGDEDAPDGAETELVPEGEIVIDDGDGDPIVIDLGDIASGDIGRLTECIGFPMFDFDLDQGNWEPGEFEMGEFDLGDLDEFFESLPFDFEALDELDGESGDLGDFGSIFGDDFDLGELDFGQFDFGEESVTVTGPDGASVIDLGESGSVTITKEDGELSISTDGDATVSEIEDLFGDFGSIFGDDFDLDDLDLDDLDLGEFGDFDLDEGALDEFFESLPFDFEALEELDLPALEELDLGDPDEIEACLDEALGR